jgi:hypothetical protein
MVWASVVDPMETLTVDPTTECDHAELVLLGYGVRTTFERCVSCGVVVIVQADRRWILRRPRGQA